MCDEQSYTDQRLSGGLASNKVNVLKDADPRIRQQEKSRSLAYEPSIREQLEKRLYKAQAQTDQTAEALKFLTPEVEKMIEAFRALNRVGMLWL